MHSPVILAVDIGTSSIRAALFPPEGKAIGLTQEFHEVSRPAPFMEEQQPDRVRELVHKAIAECLARNADNGLRVAGISFSSQMYSVFPVDGAGNALHNSILWSDGRAEAEARELKESGAAGELYRATGCPVNSIYPLAKILWFRKHRPEIFAGTARFVSIKDYVLQPLAGEWVSDYSMASGTGMFDLKTEKWATPALQATGIGEEMLPRLTAGTDALPIHDKGLARKLGLPESAAIYLGGGDGPLANIGSGASLPGSVNIDLGTSGALRAVVDKPTLDPEGRLWCYAMYPGRWAYGGIITNAGNAMQWLGTNLAFPGNGMTPDAAAARVGEMAAEVPPGSEGVLCLPYFRKARSPYWNDRLRGSMLGLTARHDIRHIARAILEAIAFDLAFVMDIVAASAEIRRPVVLTGGLSRNAMMPQLLADVLETEIAIPSHCEGSLAGAALMGLRGAGLVDGYSFRGEGGKSAAAAFTPSRPVAERYRSLKSAYRNAVTASLQIGMPAMEPS